MEENLNAPARKESVQQGVDVLSERWQQRKLLRADIAGKRHVPARRVRKSGDGVQVGTLVIGEYAIIFLDDAKVPDIVSSHPLAFIDTYRKVEGTKLFYSLKKEHFGKARTVMEFSYVLESEQEVDKLLAALDHAVLVSTKLAERNNNADLTLLDEEVHATYSRYQSTISIEAQRLEGERFKCEAVYFNDKPHFLKSLVHVHSYEHEPVVAIVNSRGIALLHASDQLEVFSWKEISGFGPKTHKLSNDSFSFAVPELHGNEANGKQAVVLVTPHALNIHKLALQYTEQATAGQAQTAFPASYHPNEMSK